jgi:signal transduction histidine kinase
VPSPDINPYDEPAPQGAPLPSNSSIFDETSSAALPIANTKVLFVSPNYPEYKQVFAALFSNNLRPVHVKRLSDVPIQQGAFQHVFIDLSVPGALDWLNKYAIGVDETFPIALIQRGEREGSALAAGAFATLQLPIEAADVLLCIKRNRARIERNRNLQEMMDRDRRRIATTSVEGVLTTLCQDLRNPLAAALANVEYMREIDIRSDGFSSEEKRNILEDTLDALRSLRSTLESLATLVKREIAEARRVVLWEIVQGVIDELGHDSKHVTLTGDPTVRGWADEDLLRQVVSTLILRSLSSGDRDNSVPAVQLRVYATESEARISVRDNGPLLSAETIKNLFEAPYAISASGKAELLLAVTHHAVVRMGGVLEYDQRQSQGSVFRIRLRLVRANE